jgi:hypothetical protein
MSAVEEFVFLVIDECTRLNVRFFITMDNFPFCLNYSQSGARISGQIIETLTAFHLKSHRKWAFFRQERLATVLFLFPKL